MAVAGYISFEQLPRRAAIDTSVMLRAFWPEEPSFAADPRTPVCVAFVDSMVRAGATVLVSAVSIAEALRFSTPRTVPRVRGIEVVAFDDQAAHIFGMHFGLEEVNALRAETGGRRNTITVDAMIVATAVRYRADMIVSIDGDFARLAALAGITARTPDDFRERQTDLGV